MPDLSPHAAPTQAVPDGVVPTGHGVTRHAAPASGPPVPRSSGAALPPSHYAAAFLVMLLWGLNVVVVKLGTAELPPLFLTTLRFVVVATLVTPFFRLSRRHLRRVLALSVTLGTAHFGLIFTGISGTDAATAAILIQLGVPFSVILAVAIYREPLGGRRLAGLILAFGGVLLLAGEPGRAALIPVVLLAGAGLAWAISNLIMARLTGAHPLAVMGWIALFAVPQLGLGSLVLEDGQAAALASAGWRGWGAIAYTALAATIVAHSLWYHLLQLHPINRVVPFSLLAPLIGAAAGVLLLGDPLTWPRLLGGLVTLTGVAVIELRPGVRHAART